MFGVKGFVARTHSGVRAVVLYTLLCFLAVLLSPVYVFETFFSSKNYFTFSSPVTLTFDLYIFKFTR